MKPDSGMRNLDWNSSEAERYECASVYKLDRPAARLISSRAAPLAAAPLAAANGRQLPFL